MALHDNTNVRLLDAAERGDCGDKEFLATAPTSAATLPDVKPKAVYGDGRVFFASKSTDERRLCCTWRTLRCLLAAATVVFIVLIVLVLTGVVPLGWHGHRDHSGMQGPSMNEVGGTGQDDRNGQQRDQNMGSGRPQQPMGNGQGPMPNGSPSQVAANGQQQLPMSRDQPNGGQQLPMGGQQRTPFGNQQQKPNGQQPPRGGQQPPFGNQPQMQSGGQQPPMGGQPPFGNQPQMQSGGQLPPMGGLQRRPFGNQQEKPNGQQPPMGGQQPPIGNLQQMQNGGQPQIAIDGQPMPINVGAKNAGGAANLLQAAPMRVHGLAPLINPDETGTNGGAAVNAVDGGYQPLQVDETGESAVLSPSEMQRIAQNALRDRQLQSGN